MTTDHRPRFFASGDSALVVEFGDEIAPAINQRVHALDRRLQQNPLPGIVETVPTYRSLLLHYDPLALDYQSVLQWVTPRVSQAEAAPPAPSRLIEIPTVYGGEHGPDLGFVAQHNGLAVADVIRLHSEREYRVYMMGFTPGFAYLGLLDPSIAAPRLETPRTFVRAGSVGIAGNQTGIYPIDSPGGWRLIGSTALRLFDPDREPPALLAPGDRVRFVPVATPLSRRGTTGVEHASSLASGEGDGG